jgi:hypothetical protein
MHELDGPDLPLTAAVLGTNDGGGRTTVTTVAGELQRIDYDLHIVDLAQIQQWACECDEDVRSHYRRIFSSNEE